MSVKPYFTSSDLIASVQRKIAIPLNQRTFSNEDVLAFANEELMISQVPDILIYHEEFFVTNSEVTLETNRTRYPIPERALGQKLRDLFYKDQSGNLFEMTRINPNDKAYWQRETATTNVMQKYYIEGNDIVLAPTNITNPTGNLVFSYFLRPNQLVLNEKAAICQSFFKEVALNNANMVVGDTITVGSVVFTAVAGAPAALEFEIGVSSAATAANLVNAINTEGTYGANNGSPATNIVSVIFSARSTTITTNNDTAFVIGSNLNIQFTNLLPSHIVDGISIDFLQTKAGHKTLAMSVVLPNNSVSDDSISLSPSLIPENFVVGDYICEEYECIIPQIPSDLHSGLAERVCGRILAAQGDMQGLQMVDAKLAQVKNAEGSLLDNRVEGSTMKVSQRKGMLSWLRMGARRRV